jgi:uncharacterized protein
MLRDRLTADLKDAMRAGDKLKTSTIRLITAAIKSAEIDARPAGKGDLTDADVIAVMTKMVKQRRDSMEQYTAGGRADLSDKEAAEIAIIEAYLPQKLGEDAMRAAVAAAVTETGAQSVKDMGKVMGALKAKYAGQMDFGRVGALVKDALK